MLRKGIVAIIALAMALPLIPAAPAFAATDGDVTGSFGINAAPTVDSVSLAGTAMTPQQNYTFSVVVSDPDSIADLGTVVLKLWYDATGAATGEADYDGATADVQNATVVTWTHTGDTSSTTEITPAGTTWELVSSTVPTTTGNFEGTTFTFEFEVKIGKVATETDSPAKWQIGAKATDDQSQTGYNNDTEGATMAWYGEIDVQSATVAWGTLPAGTTYTDAVAKQGLDAPITYISNGGFDHLVKSTDWLGDGTATATLANDGDTSTAQQFALKANVADNEGTAVQVTDAVGGVSITTGAQTGEAGTDVDPMYLYIELANTFESETYSGTITFLIAND